MNGPLVALRSGRGVLFTFVCSVATLVPGQLMAQNLPTAKPESVGMSSERLGRIRVAMQRYVDRNDVAGVVTLVARKGRVVHLEAVGYRDAEAKAPMTADTIFR